jgi:3-oxoacyl-[acyl-carrier protein] reductase
MFMHGKSEELVQSIVRGIPLGRLGQPDDIAPVVSFLASPEGGWVNGQVLRANGGML